MVGNYKNKKIPKFTATDAFLTIKDHKKHFPFNIECRVLNPAKNELGRISKTILEKAVRDIRAKTPLTQWKNSHDVIVWFENIKQKNKKCFLTFDIINFYPSITPTPNTSHKLCTRIYEHRRKGHKTN